MSNTNKKPKDQTITTYRSFTLPNPPHDQLEPIYTPLQNLLNTTLTKPKYRNKILQLNPKQPRGQYWLKVKTILNPEIRKLPIKNKTWYSYQAIEQLRQTHASLIDKQATWRVIQDHNRKIDEAFWNDLHNQGLYPTAGEVRNLRRSKVEPTLPEHIQLVMDYSISNAQANALTNPDDPLDFIIQTAEGDWFHYKIHVPAYVLAKPGFTGLLTKPKFWRDKDTGEWRGSISYGITPEEHDLESQGIMGIDLGQLHYYMGVIVNPDGSYEDPFTNSRFIQHCQDKNDRRYKSVRRLRRLNKLARRSGDGDSLIVARREAEIEATRGKASRCKDSMARVAAVEIVSEAVTRGVREIHVESLSWLDSMGGAWDHSRFQSYLREECEEHGVLLVVVNAHDSSKQHPVTGEVGRIVGRVVWFEDGLRVDRDVLAALNLAGRSGTRSKRNKRVRGKTVKPVRVARVRAKHSVTPRRLRRPRRGRFPLVRRVGCSSFNVDNSGRGVIVASLPVSSKSCYPRVRDGWIMGSSEVVIMSHLVTLSNKSDTSN